MFPSSNLRPKIFPKDCNRGPGFPEYEGRNWSLIGLYKKEYWLVGRLVGRSLVRFGWLVARLHVILLTEAKIESCHDLARRRFFLTTQPYGSCFPWFH